MPETSSRRIYRPSDDAEARLIESLLQEQGIDCMVVQHQDTAYPGIGDRRSGWGEIRVDPQDVERAEACIREWQQAESEDLEQAAMRTPRETEPTVGPGGRTALTLMLVLAVLLVLAALRIGAQ